MFRLICYLLEDCPYPPDEHPTYNPAGLVHVGSVWPRRE